jgi:Na+-driven multidrug efflux pump
MLPVIWFLPYLMEDKTLAIWLSMPVSDIVCCLLTLVPFVLHMRFLSKVNRRAESGI